MENDYFLTAAVISVQGNFRKSCYKWDISVHYGLEVVMNAPNFEHAAAYARQRLSTELAPHLTYHSLVHTAHEVVPAVRRFAALESVTGESEQLLVTAAWFHDLGYVVQINDHERISAEIAASVLPGLGFSNEQVEVIRGIIQATRLPQSPSTLLEQIMADADLNVLGQEDFLLRNEDLRAELAVIDHPVTDSQWYTGQLAFLRAHNYFTRSATLANRMQKSRNINLLIELMAKCQDKGSSVQHTEASNL
ncbi:MAG: HD domain-containing protein [Chloroflexota bacterium]|nr:HD domain-containing protein [Chloroflexota bacterium]